MATTDLARKDYKVSGSLKKQGDVVTVSFVEGLTLNDTAVTYADDSTNANGISFTLGDQDATYDGTAKTAFTVAATTVPQGTKKGKFVVTATNNSVPTVFEIQFQKPEPAAFASPALNMAAELPAFKLAAANPATGQAAELATKVAAVGAVATAFVAVAMAVA